MAEVIKLREDIRPPVRGSVAWIRMVRLHHSQFRIAALKALDRIKDQSHGG